MPVPHTRDPGRWLSLVVLTAILAACGGDGPDPDTDVIPLETATRFADLAMNCIGREYPNKLGQVLQGPGDLKPPHALHPAFFGCFDWHSSVHGHWMLVKLLKTVMELPRRDEIASALYRSLGPEHIAGEVRYFENASPSWERTYGWAWLLQLATELHTWDDPLGKELAGNLQPLAQAIRDRYLEFLPKQDYPIRTGVHPNTAFGLSFAFDYAVAVEDGELEKVVVDAATRYYAEDEDCPMGWEPGGEDFLSPCLEEAALMARVLGDRDYRHWLERFLPGLGDAGTLTPAKVSDRSDPKIVHLDGVNLSRAWNLRIVAAAIGDEEMASRLREVADEHLDATLPWVGGEHYEGSHWLGSFAVYALTRAR